MSPLDVTTIISMITFPIIVTIIECLIIIYPAPMIAVINFFKMLGLAIAAAF